MGNATARRLQTQLAHAARDGLHADGQLVDVVPLDVTDGGSES